MALPIQPLSLESLLIKRGIADAANDAGWRPYRYFDQDGWKYPLYLSSGKVLVENGKTIHRWKNANSEGEPKYVWPDGKPDRARYYLLPGTVEAIRQNHGMVYIASGEPDVLALRAAGINNALCWFGEKSIPPTFVTDMQDTLSVWRVVYLADCDKTGMIAAASLQKLISGSELSLDVIKLPGEMGSKFDVNKLWMDCSFDAARFRIALIESPQYDAGEIALYNDAAAAPQLRLLPPAQSDDLPQGFIDAILRDVESREGFKRWGSDGWSNNFACPIHKDEVPSAGYNRDSHSFNCFAQCGKKSAKEYGEAVGIYLRDFFEKEPAKPSKAVDLSSAPSGAQDAMPLPVPTAPYIDSYEAMAELLEELEGRKLAAAEPCEFPYHVLHEFGGFAELMQPGKLVFISGVSGGQKTSMGEYMGESYLRTGEDYIWFGPEWTPTEMAMRALQRGGGFSMNEFNRMRLNQIDASRNVPSHSRRGFAPNDAMRNDSIDRLKRMMMWKGRAYYIRDAGQGLVDLIATIRGIVLDRRAAGRKVRHLFFDYLQRAPLGGRKDWTWGETVVGMIKSLCEELELFGYVFVQPSKGASRATRNGEALNESSGQGVSDQQCNLYISITPHFDETGNRLNHSTLSILKNSMGRTGEISVETCPERLMLLDRKVIPTNVSLRDIEENEDIAL